MPNCKLEIDPQITPEWKQQGHIPVK